MKAVAPAQARPLTHLAVADNILKDSDAAKRANVTHSKKDPGTSMSPGSRTTELAAVLTIQWHAKTHQQPTAWPGYDCMGWEYDPLYDGLEWPPQHIRSAYRNIGPHAARCAHLRSA